MSRLAFGTAHRSPPPAGARDRPGVPYDLYPNVAEMVARDDLATYARLGGVDREFRRVIGEMDAARPWFNRRAAPAPTIRRTRGGFEVERDGESEAPDSACISPGGDWIGLVYPWIPEGSYYGVELVAVHRDGIVRRSEPGVETDEGPFGITDDGIMYRVRRNDGTDRRRRRYEPSLVMWDAGGPDGSPIYVDLVGQVTASKRYPPNGFFRVHAGGTRIALHRVFRGTDGRPDHRVEFEAPLDPSVHAREHNANHVYACELDLSGRNISVAYNGRRMTTVFSHLGFRPSEYLVFRTDAHAIVSIPAGESRVVEDDGWEGGYSAPIDSVEATEDGFLVTRIDAAYTDPPCEFGLLGRDGIDVVRTTREMSRFDAVYVGDGLYLQPMAHPRNGADALVLRLDRSAPSGPAFRRVGEIAGQHLASQRLASGAWRHVLARGARIVIVDGHFASGRWRPVSRPDALAEAAGSRGDRSSPMSRTLAPETTSLTAPPLKPRNASARIESIA